MLIRRAEICIRQAIDFVEEQTYMTNSKTTGILFND